MVSITVLVLLAVFIVLIVWICRIRNKLHREKMVELAEKEAAVADTIPFEVEEWNPARNGAKNPPIENAASAKEY